MKQQRELQVMEISSGNVRRSQEKEGSRQALSAKRKRKKRKKRKIVCTFFRTIFLTASFLVLAYVAVVGVLLYRQNHPEAVNFDKLQANRSSSLTSIVGELTGLEEELQELLERNEETRDFVENYKNREDYLGKDIDLSKDVQEGIVPLLMQWDKRWGYESFGNSNIGLAGCGPTCLSMAYLYFTNDLKGNPREIARYCEENGFYTSEGTSWDLWTVGVQAFGLSGEELPLDENRMKKVLDAGSLIICSMRPGDFTTTGHYILIVGYNEEGFVVNDPNRRSNSEKIWDYDTLDGQIRNLWKISS